MLDRKKRIKEESGHRGSTKHSKGFRKRKQNVLSADFTLLCLINSLLSGSPRTFVWGENSHNSIKGARSSWPLYLINVCVCVGGCVHVGGRGGADMWLSWLSHHNVLREDLPLPPAKVKTGTSATAAPNIVLLQFYGIRINY